MSAIAAPAQRARDLVRLAVDAGAAEAEARTAAHTACRLIVKHGLFLVSAEEIAQLPTARHEPPLSTVARRRVIRSRFRQRCISCARAIHVGDRCIWVMGRGVLHLECEPCS